MASGIAKRRARAAPPTCRVDDCGCDLLNNSKYSIRQRICEDHLRAQQVTYLGESCRFCQQCACLHPVVEFEGQKRSCRASLTLRLKQRKRHRDPGARKVTLRIRSPPPKAAPCSASSECPSQTSPSARTKSTDTDMGFGGLSLMSQSAAKCPQDPQLLGLSRFRGSSRHGLTGAPCPDEDRLMNRSPGQLRDLTPDRLGSAAVAPMQHNPPSKVVHPQRNDAVANPHAVSWESSQTPVELIGPDIRDPLVPKMCWHDGEPTRPFQKVIHITNDSCTAIEGMVWTTTNAKLVPATMGVGCDAGKEGEELKLDGEVLIKWPSWLMEEGTLELLARENSLNTHRGGSVLQQGGRLSRGAEDSSSPGPSGLHPRLRVGGQCSPTVLTHTAPEWNPPSRPDQMVLLRQGPLSEDGKVSLNEMKGMLSVPREADLSCLKGPRGYPEQLALRHVPDLAQYHQQSEGLSMEAAHGSPKRLWWSGTNRDAGSNDLEEAVNLWQKDIYSGPCFNSPEQGNTSTSPPKRRQIFCPGVTGGSLTALHPNMSNKVNHVLENSRMGPIPEDCSIEMLYGDHELHGYVNGTHHCWKIRPTEQQGYGQMPAWEEAPAHYMRTPPEEEHACHGAWTRWSQWEAPEAVVRSQPRTYLP